MTVLLALAEELLSALADEFPDASAAEVRRAVDEAVALFAEARIDLFVPVLARREAAQRLRGVRTPYPPDPRLPVGATRISTASAG